MTQFQTAEGELEPVGDLPRGVRSDWPLWTWTRTGWVVRTASLSDLPVNSVEGLLRLLEALGPGDAEVWRQRLVPGEDPKLLLVCGAGSSLRGFGIGKDGSQINEYAVVAERTQRGARVAEETRIALEGARVGIVGLGSLGSKVAVSLARTGVSKFVLVDDDVLLPDNICRNDLNWSAVGLHKVAGVKELLSLIGKDEDVVTFPHRLAGQESSKRAATVLKRLGECDVVVDATANPDVFALLAAVARRYLRPICWGEVFAGGIGGLVARARPTHDPNPLATRNAINAHLSKLPEAPNKSAQDYTVDGGEPLQASDCDVGQIAASLTSMALDVLADPDSTRFPYAAYLIGLRTSWIFTEPFDTHPIDVQGEGWGGGTESPEERQAATEILAGLLLKQYGDATGTS